MNIKTRLKFLTGIITVLSIGTGLFVYLEYNMSRVNSIDAQLASDTYTVGIDYSGIIEKRFVDEGAYVKTKDPLFEIRSSTLSTAIKNNEIAKAALLYSVNDEGLVLISAAAPGQVQTISYREGAFVPANSQIALVNIDNKAFINATYKLSSPDYARLDKNSKIRATFPDNKTVEGTVYDISLQTVDKEIQTTVRARFDRKATNTNAFTVGTPVETTLYLDNDTLFNRISANLSSVFQPKSGK